MDALGAPPAPPPIKPRRGCCEQGVKGFLLHTWTSVLLLAITAVFWVLAKVRDDDGPGWWLGVAIAGSIPGAKAVVWLVDVIVRCVAPDVVVWYLEVVLRHLVPSLWAAAVLIAIARNPVAEGEDNTGHMVLRSIAWIVVLWSVVRSVAQMGLNFLHHVVTLNDTPTKRLLLRRALMILAQLHSTIVATGNLTPRSAAAAGEAAEASGKGAVYLSRANSTKAPARNSLVQELQSVATGGDAGAGAGAGAGAPTSARGASAGIAVSGAGVGAAASAGTAGATVAPVTTSTVATMSTAAITAGGNQSLIMRAQSDRTSKRMRTLPSSSPITATALRVAALRFASGSPRSKIEKPVVQDSPATLDSFLGHLEDNDKRAVAVDTLFDSMRSKRRGKLVVTSVSLQKVLNIDDASLLVEQLGLFRAAFSRDEFAIAVRDLFTAYNRASTARQNNHTWILRALVDVMLICIIPVAFLLLMQVDPVSVFVPVGSSLLAASFVFAPSVQNFVTCLIFVLIQHPYDVGDVIGIDGVAYRVEKISLMNSAVVATVSKTRTYLPHIQLANRFIENSARSNHAQAVATVYVDPSITAQQVRELQAKLKVYMQEESKDDWQQPADPYIIAADVRPDDGKVAVKVYGATWVPWRSRGAVFKVASGLTLATMKALRELNVSFEHVPLRVRMLND